MDKLRIDDNAKPPSTFIGSIFSIKKVSASDSNGTQSLGNKMDKLRIDDNAKPSIFVPSIFETNKVCASDSKCTKSSSSKKSSSSEFGGMKRGFLIAESFEPKAQIVDNSIEMGKEAPLKISSGEIFVSKNLKIFSAKKCRSMNENVFRKYLLSLPCLEEINVSQTAIRGHCFNLLPEGLKELRINSCRKVSKGNLHKVIQVCKNLEVLEIEKLDVDDKFLEDLGYYQSNLRILKVSPSKAEVSNQIKVFTKLTSLKIVASTFELANIANDVKDLEKLHIKIRHKTTELVDFGKFSRLKNLVIFGPFRKKELMSLGKCKNLQYVTIMQCGDADQMCIRNIVQECPVISIIGCRKVEFDINFMDDINEIMKTRSQKIDILGKKGAMTCNEFTNYYWDSKKVNFDFNPIYFFESDDDFDDDDTDDDEYFCDSDGNYDHISNRGRQ